MLPESGSHYKLSAPLPKQGHFPQTSTRTQEIHELPGRKRVFNYLSYANKAKLLSATEDDPPQP